MCVCVCVCVREKERQKERETLRGEELQRVECRCWGGYRQCGRGFNVVWCLFT